jgi:hypothetical protein
MHAALFYRITHVVKCNMQTGMKYGFLSFLNEVVSGATTMLPKIFFKMHIVRRNVHIVIMIESISSNVFIYFYEPHFYAYCLSCWAHK